MKKEKVTDIEELIADAKAEEEVAREQAKAEKEAKDKEDFRDVLREQLKEAFKPKVGEKVTIDLQEYITLCNKAMDLDRILNIIVDEFKLGYDNTYLRIEKEERIADAFRVLYPDVYDHLLAIELDQEENEGE